MLFAFQSVSEFEKVSFKVSDRLLYQSSRVFEKIVFESFLKSVGVKSCFVCLKRASTQENSTYSKELGCVRVL